MPSAPTAGPLTVDEIARAVDAIVDGDGSLVVRQVNTLEHAQRDEIGFLANPKYRGQLATTQAGAIVLAPDHVADAKARPADGASAGAYSGTHPGTHPGTQPSTQLRTYPHRTLLITPEPYLAYARIAQLLNPTAIAQPGVARTAAVAAGARMAASASIGERVVVDDGATIGDAVVVHPGVVIGARCSIGARTVIHPNAVLYPGTIVGDDCVIHAGAVLGADGFGIAESGAGWVRIPQIGCVVLGNRVEVGANTTIDRGALDDTVIDDDVKLDNQIQIGHNVRIGQATAIAGCVGIAGSVRIGKNCRIGGAAMISGHIEIGDRVTIAGGTVVAKSLPEPGVYAGVYPLDTMNHWRRTAVRVRKLDELASRLEAMEKAIRTQKPTGMT